jgi:predicted CXXCH cytochrome family protein
VLAALATIGISCARVEVKPPAAVPIAEGKVRGVAVPKGISVSLEGAVVQAGDKQTRVTSNGAFSFPAMNPGKQNLVVEKPFPSGKVRRVLGIATIFVGESTVEVKIPVRDATEVDIFCLECHPLKKDITRNDQIYRDAHPSGIVAKKATSDPALLDARGMVTCESCHTVHRTTEYPLFGVGRIKTGTFCNRCHASRRR